MVKFKSLTVSKICKLPQSPGIYAFKKNGKFLYIGKATNLRERTKQHTKLMNLTQQLGYIKSKTDREALLLEAKLIKKYQPKYNISWKDDKNYFYVGISKEAFPRIFLTHQPKNRSQTEYLGPFVSGRKLKQKLRELRKIYPYRTCKTLPKKPCLWYHLGQCPAPCLFRAKRIEAYDIANIQGKEASGSMITFINGKPAKNFYRRFKIKLTAKPNDLAMLKEILSRRFRHPEWPYANLILIDGGRAQLNLAASLTEIPIMAIAKKNNELYMENLKKPVLLKNLPRETFNLILELRDEAHRFARKYHHYLRKKHLFD
jgi:excinuclease UvrABC nuclease subunit